MDLISYIENQKIWSVGAFGPGNRDEGIIDHIKKELVEIKESPGDLEEWIDVIILALDGAWRNGHTAKNIAGCLRYEQIKSREREWPDWRTAEPGKAIEHIKIESSGLEPALKVVMEETLEKVQLHIDKGPAEPKEFKPACFGTHYAELGPCCINCKLSYECSIDRGPIV